MMQVNNHFRSILLFVALHNVFILTAPLTDNQGETERESERFVYWSLCYRDYHGVNSYTQRSGKTSSSPQSNSWLDHIRVWSSGHSAEALRSSSGIWRSVRNGLRWFASEFRRRIGNEISQFIRWCETEFPWRFSKAAREFRRDGDKSGLFEYWFEVKDEFFPEILSSTSSHQSMKDEWTDSFSRTLQESYWNNECLLLVNKDENTRHIEGHVHWSRIRLLRLTFLLGQHGEFSLSDECQCLKEPGPFPFAG